MHHPLCMLYNIQVNYLYIYTTKLFINIPFIFAFNLILLMTFINNLKYTIIYST